MKVESEAMVLSSTRAQLGLVRPNARMVQDVSNSRGAERDLFRRWTSAFLLWCLPWIAFVLGYGAPAVWRTVLWTTSLAFMGGACLLNASHCGRTHCLFTGPFFILGAICSLGYGLRLLPLGSSGWKWIGTVTIIGAIVLCCIPELIFGRYRQDESNST